MKKLLITICAVCLLLTGCGEDGNNSTGDKLIIGIDDEFAPMGFRNEYGKIVGFDIDLAEEAARRMNVAIEFKPIDWDKKEDEITSGNVDMIWNGCDIMEEYKRYMIFSRPYMDNRQILLVRHGNDKGIKTAGDLAGKKVGTQAGSNSEDYVNADEKLRNSFAAFITYRNIKEAFRALLSEECDVLIIDEIAGRYEMIKNPDMFELVEETIGLATEIGIGFRKDNAELRDKVQATFDEMIKDGTAREISLKWFQADLIK